MAGALDGIRVIDFGQFIAGPMASMLLTDHGADVIHIDPPGGPRWDTPANATWNRGKRNIILDLKTPSDLDVARELVRTADVVVENFRPGVMDRLGIGSKDMTAANRQLIYCSLPGFASDDPRAGVRAWEGVLGAATACFRPRTGRGDPGKLNYGVIPISSLYGAYWGAVSIVAALHAREVSGAGQVIEVPLFDATFGAIGNVGMNVTAGPSQQPFLVRMWTSLFQCKDGRLFQYHAANKRFRDFLEATGAAAWADIQMEEQAYRRRVEELFRTRTALEWEQLCAAIGTEGAMVRTAAEWVENPQARGSEMIVDFLDPVLGKTSGPGVNVRLSGTPLSTRLTRSAPDADRRAILDELQSVAPKQRPTSPVRAALEGIRVLDLSIILAGPTCGRTLAEFGADVIKIDSPHVDWVNGHVNVNCGKRTILLDLKTRDGLAIFWKLVERSDVIIQNFRNGVAEAMGIGYEAVRARKPQIVYASLNMYGEKGPWSGRPGHEQIAQAVSGIAERGGVAYPIHDYATGFMGAYGIILALLHRRRTGLGQHVSTALAYTATMNQSSLLQVYEGKQWDEPRGHGILGSGPLNRAYRARDGWVFISGTQEQITAVSELSSLRGRMPSELEAELETTIADGDVAAWVESLTNAGAGAHRVVETMDEIMDEPWVVAHGLSLTREHEGLGMIRTPGPAPRLSETPVQPGWPSHPPGSDAAEILAEINMAGELRRLIEDGVIAIDGVRAGY